MVGERLAINKYARVKENLTDIIFAKIGINRRLCIFVLTFTVWGIT